MSESSGFRRRFSRLVLYWLACLMLVASFPTLASAVVFCLRGGSRNLFAWIVAGVAGAAFLGVGVLGIREARRSVASPEPPERPPDAESDGRVPARTNWLRWPLAVVFTALAGLLIVPAAIEQVRWRRSFGLLEMPSQYPPGFHWFLLQVVGFAVLMIVAGLVFQKEQLIGWGGALFVIIAVGTLLGGILFVLIPR